MEEKVTIIGAGVVGLSLALSLHLKGFSVLLIDCEDGVGKGASYANGAQLSYRYVSPLADKGVIFQSLKWVWKVDSPLNFRVNPSIEQWKWLSNFMLACNAQTNKINGDNILRLSLLSQSILEGWRKNNYIGDFAWKKSGKMIIHRNQSDFNTASNKIDPEFQKLLSPSEICDLEPSLNNIKKELKGAIYSPDDETADAYLYCKGILKYLKKQPNFELVLNSYVEKILTKNNKVVALKVKDEEISVSRLVIASGNGARNLLLPLGISLPIYPLKGYSLTIPFTDQNVAPICSVTDYAYKTVYAKLENKLRIAAMVDIGYQGTDIRESRIQALKSNISATFPNIKNLDSAEVWAGLRPSTPKGPPILGKTSLDNLWINVGHGSLGFTLASGSAEVLTNIILNETPKIDLMGLTL